MKRFSLYILLLITILALNSCRLVSRVGHSIFSNKVQIESSFSNREIDSLIFAAKNYQGVAYRLGGIDEKGMDCSGLLFRTYADQNFSIPRVTSKQALYGLPVSVDALAKGDWVFFKTNGSTSLNHVGLVTDVKSLREIIFIHASTSKCVREDNLYSNYWFNVFQQAIRPFKNK